MHAARINGFGPPTVLQVGPGPALRAARPGELLIRLRATSVNPIDCMRRTGYGKKLLGILGAARFPLILGHDIAGEVEQAPEDPAARSHGFQEGDKVFGALPPAGNGTYASHCLALPEWLQPLPEGLTFEQAATLPYVALTGFSAFRNLKLNGKTAVGKRVLIQGGSGGVGSFCTQLLSSWGALVTTLSGKANQGFCRKLGAAEALNYNALEAGDLQSFDAVLAAFGMEDGVHFHPRLLAEGGAYTTLRHPLLAWSDRYGLLPGAASAGSLFASRRLRWARRGRRYCWSFFSVNNNGMNKLCEALAKEQLHPLQQQTLPLAKVAEAHTTSEAGHVRGKLVLKIP